MKKLLLSLAMLCAAHSNAYAIAAVGSAAPNFTAKTASGKTVKLSDYKGKIVVLEWNNPHCPFVKKFYGAGEMQKWQTGATQKGVIWLTVNSSAKGKDGYVDAKSAAEFVEQQQSKASEYLLDSEGKIGKLYGAKTTPHMFVIDKTGVLAYSGAIDDKPTPRSEDIAGAKNYVGAALNYLYDDRSVEIASTQAYGCGVKY